MATRLVLCFLFLPINALGKRRNRKEVVTLKPKQRKKITLTIRKGTETGKPKTEFVEEKTSRKVKLRRFITLTTEKPKPRVEIRQAKEIHKHIDNALVVILSSNATPIRCHGGIGYKCCFCPEQFPEAKDLKTHTIQQHDEIEKKKFSDSKTMLKYSVKLDVTDLKCQCGKGASNLDELIEHLESKHGKTYHKDIKSHIIPFKFETKEIRCAICNNEFNNFKVLSEHMNVHYSNHVCEFCGAGFVNRRTLLTHCYRHQMGTFQCSYCPKTYDTKIKKRDHERAVHIRGSMCYKCAFCGQKFSDYRKKKIHEAKSHGAPPVVLKCRACDKTFDSQGTLTMHTKKFHLM